MLVDFDIEINSYTQRRKMKPEYIIINPNDIDLLIEDMIRQKLLTNAKPVGKLQYNGIRIIKSEDILQGYFTVVGA